MTSHPVTCLGNSMDNGAWQVRHNWVTEHTQSWEHKRPQRAIDHFSWGKNGAGERLLTSDYTAKLQ